MNKINEKNLKIILKEMLYYLDDLCEKNNIKYSLIGGSLIGAIRHKDMIPWDDDIDIILTPENYTKLIKILEKESDKYYLLSYKNNSDYYYPFVKLVNRETNLVEMGAKKIRDYGVYVDIFRYNFLPNDEKKQKKFYSKIIFYKKIFAWISIERKKQLNFKTKMKILIGNIYGSKRAIKNYNKLLNKYSNTQFVVSNWPCYGFDKEVQMYKNLTQYQKVKFGQREAMVFKNYDAVLKTTFNDYMKLPPKNKQISNHNYIATWKVK